MKQITKRQIIGILTAAFLFLFVTTANAEPTARERLEAAREQYALALAGHCSVIGAKTLDCYSGGDCEALQESIQWFMGVDGYGTPPEVLCKQKPNLK
jgi:hypothetical protein